MSPDSRDKRRSLKGKDVCVQSARNRARMMSSGGTSAGNGGRGATDGADSSARDYYDSVVSRRLADYVDGNPRVDRAFSSLVAEVSHRPQRILDLGCGVGVFSYWMHQRWPKAQVVGVDYSSRSIGVAGQLFGDKLLRYEKQDLRNPSILRLGRFDIITMIDVYEHVRTEDRPVVHDHIGQLLSDQSLLFLTTPTPAYQDYLRREDPAGLQPVDEDIDLRELGALAQSTRMDIVQYKKVSIWRCGDYAHTVMMRPPLGAEALVEAGDERGPRSIWSRLRRKLVTLKRDHERSRRRERCAQLLGNDRTSGG